MASPYTTGRPVGRGALVEPKAALQLMAWRKSRARIFRCSHLAVLARRGAPWQPRNQPGPRAQRSARASPLCPGAETGKEREKKGDGKGRT